MSQTTTKVDGIIKTLSNLEANIDSLNEKLADMKKHLNSTAQKEIDQLMEKVKNMATKEAEHIILESKTRAESESAKILQEGDKNLADIQQNIDSNFDSAVKESVSTIMKS
jgi:V/A-type H+-transporting ATPase subunit G/H